MCRFLEVFYRIEALEIGVNRCRAAAKVESLTRLLQDLKTSKISGFVSGRGQTSPLPWLGRPQARLIHDLEKQIGGSSIRKHSYEGFHDILKRLALGKPGGNESRQGPKRLRLGITTPTSC